MEHSCRFDAATLAKDSKRVGFGLAGVDHDRQPPIACHLKLRAEHGLLDLTRGEVVVIVEPDFADGTHVRHAVEPLAEQPSRGFGVCGERSGLMRMDADRGTRLRPELPDPLPSCQFHIILCGQDDDRRVNAGLLRTGDHLG